MGIPCYGKNCGSEGDDPFKPKPPAPPAPHGSYTVQSGDSCWAIAAKLCQDGNNWKIDICNAFRMQDAPPRPEPEVRLQWQGHLLWAGGDVHLRARRMKAFMANFLIILIALLSSCDTGSARALLN